MASPTSLKAIASLAQRNHDERLQGWQTETLRHVIALPLDVSSQAKQAS
jgi:hypothetical protein